jgi:hypothetical protein
MGGVGDQENSFRSLKDAVKSAPVLQLPDPACDTTPHMGEQDRCADSELSAFLGAVLSQMGYLMFTEIMEP